MKPWLRDLLLLKSKQETSLEEFESNFVKKHPSGIYLSRGLYTTREDERKLRKEIMTYNF